MVKKIRIMLDYKCYPVWLYDENGDIIDTLLPEELRDYVMLHELCHLKEMNHGPRFHALLESVCPGHRVLEKELRLYRIR